MTFWDHVAHAVAGAVKHVRDAVVHSVEAAARWTAGVLGIDGGTGRIANIDDEVDAILAGNSEAWHTGAVTARQAATDHARLSTQVRDMAVKLETAWTGNAAQAAGARIQRLEVGLDSAGQTFDTNADNVASVADYFDYAQQNVKKLPKPAPEAGFLDKLAPWDTDTEQAINDYNTQSKQNAQVYKAYASHVSASKNSLQLAYGDLGSFDSGDITVSKAAVVPPGKTKPGTVNPKARQDTGDDRSTTPPGTITPPPSTVTPGGHETDTDQVTPPGGGISGDATTTAGFAPTTETVPGLGLPGGGLGVLPPGGGTGTAGGTNPYPIGGLGYLDAPGGIGSRTGSPGAGLPGGGRQTGAGVPGEAGVRGGAGPAGRAAGSRLQGGPGGMAQGGRSGKEEDSEHQRKYVLDEDTLFTEEDRKEVDPTTGLPPVPPTIGA